MPPSARPTVLSTSLADGTHTIETSAYVTERVLSAVFKPLNDQHVLLGGCLLKPNMVTPGVDCPERPAAQKIAELTVRTLARTVPPALVGVTFLSGGQSEEDASVNLSAMNQLPRERRSRDKGLPLLPLRASYKEGVFLTNTAPARRDRDRVPQIASEE
ncbi:hypothetical protein FOL46_005671, partial [Perkinsus olseni]